MRGPSLAALVSLARLGLVLAVVSAAATSSVSAQQGPRAPEVSSEGSEVLFTEDFEGGLQGWRFPLEAGHELVPRGDGGGRALALQTVARPVYALIRDSEAWGDVRIEGEVLFPEDVDAYLGFMWRYRDDGRRIDFGSAYIKGNDGYLQANPHHDTNVGRTLFPELRVPLEGASAVEVGRWTPFAVEVVGGGAHLYVGDLTTPSMTLELPAPPRGAFGFKPRNPGGAVWIDDLQVRSIDGFSYRGPARPAVQYRSGERVTDWRVLGPLTRTVPDVESAEALADDWSLSDDGRRVSWRPFRADPRGAVLTGRVTEYRGSRRVAYFHTVLHAERAGEMVLEFASADDLALWLNGRFLGFAPRQARAWWDASEDPDHPTVRARVELRPGPNDLVVRAIGGTYATGGFFLGTRPAADP